MLHVGHRLDVLVDPVVDPHQVVPCRLRQHDIAWLRGAARTLLRTVGAEFHPNRSVRA